MGSIHDLQLALELAHYAARHRGTLYVAVLAGRLAIGDFLLDLKLVGAYGLQGVMVARAQGGVARAQIEAARAQGVAFAVINGDGIFAEVVDRTRRALAGQQVPVILVGESPRTPGAGPAKLLGRRLAAALHARRLLLLTPEPDVLMDGEQRPHLTLDEARQRRAQAEGVSGERWQFILDVLGDGVPGVVVIGGEPGAVFEELFTHHGAGFLIGGELVEEVRRASPTDAADVSLLLKSEIERGVVLPVSDEEVVRSVHQHLVYTIDGLVVGTARLAPYGTWAELSRFATLPRYRGRGRARRLGEALIAWAREAGYEQLFALSVDERMWRFFESLEFEAFPREGLPESWRARYDLSRPSRAFSRKL